MNPLPRGKSSFVLPNRDTSCMVCLACCKLSPGPLCLTCAGGLKIGPERLLANRLTAQAAYLHTGTARTLVHNFKYRGIVRAGRLLAEGMASHIPEGCSLVPLPRVDWRLLRYGIDPAPELARLLSILTGAPVLNLLTPPALSRDQARRSRTDRQPPMFKVRSLVPGPFVLIDDVVTTGGTLESVHRLLGAAVSKAVTATASPR